VAFRFAGGLPLTGFVGSPKGSRGSRLGREREMGQEVYGGGYGMGNYVNIENNPIQNVSTISNTGNIGAGGEQPKPPTPTPPTPTPPTPTPRAGYTSDDVRFTSTYSADLPSQAAAGKAAQLLERTIGSKNIKDQSTFNKLFEPLYKDLQSGMDYGADIDRFYKASRSAGYEPYKTTQTDIRTDLQGAEGYAPFVTNLLQPSKMGEFYDPADYGRRILEAKAYYRPGGVGTNLSAIGNVQNEIDRLGENVFYGKTQPYKGGYRAGIPANTNDPFRAYYDAYLKGL